MPAPVVLLFHYDIGVSAYLLARGIDGLALDADAGLIRIDLAAFPPGPARWWRAPPERRTSGAAKTRIPVTALLTARTFKQRGHVEGSRRGDVVALMTNVRLPCRALASRVKDKVSPVAVVLPTLMLEMPSFGLMLTCPMPTRERSKHPEDVTLKVGELPTTTWVGEIPMSGTSCTAVTANGTAAAALLARIVSIRVPARAQLARLNDKVRPDAVTPLIFSLGLMVTCPELTLERSNPPEDAMIKVAEVPAGMGGGAMLMAGGP